MIVFFHEIAISRIFYNWRNVDISCKTWIEPAKIVDHICAMSDYRGLFYIEVFTLHLMWKDLPGSRRRFAE